MKKWLVAAGIALIGGALFLLSLDALGTMGVLLLGMSLVTVGIIAGGR